MFTGIEAQQPHLIDTLEIPSGDSGIYQTCYRMKKEMLIGSRSPEVVNLAHGILRDRQGLSQREQSQLLTSWFVQNIEYRLDEDLTFTEKGYQFVNLRDCPRHFKKCESVELLYLPTRVLKQGSGDCDDFCMALGALHESIGIPTRFKVISLNPSTREFTHVYLLVRIEGAWIPVDAVNKSQPWGWESPRKVREQIVC